MAERSPAEWQAYCEARRTFLREQVQLGLPLHDPEGRQGTLDFAQLWKNTHRPDERSWSVKELQALMDKIMAGQSHDRTEGMSY